MTARVRQLPGVVAAGFTGSIPADDGGPTLRLVPEGGAAAPDRDLGVQMIVAMPDLWDALGIRLLEGRTFRPDEARAPHSQTVIVNRRLAASVARRQCRRPHRCTSGTARNCAPLRVIGVSPDLVYEELGEETEQSQLNLFLPAGGAGWRTMALSSARRARGTSGAGAVRAALLHDVDPAIAPFDVLTMRDRRAFTQWGERFLGQMFAAFALAALLMACLGAYGVMAYSAAQRTREIGVRLALGATGRDVVWLFLRRGIVLTALGLLIGAPLAFATARARRRAPVPGFAVVAVGLDRDAAHARCRAPRRELPAGVACQPYRSRDVRCDRIDS